MADTHVNAYRRDYHDALEAAEVAKGNVETTGRALDTKLDELGEPREYQPEKKSSKSASKPDSSSEAPEPTKYVGVKKADLLKEAKKVGADGVSKDSTNKEIAAAIDAAKGAK